jgi:hypothetical protein
MRGLAVPFARPRSSWWSMIAGAEKKGQERAEREGERGHTDDFGALPITSRDVVVDEGDSLDAVVEVVGLDRELFDGEEVAVAGAHLPRPRNELEIQERREGKDAP